MILQIIKNVKTKLSRLQEMKYEVSTESDRIHVTTWCAGKILEFLNVEGVTWNARTQKNVWKDTIRRSGKYLVRSRVSAFKRAETVTKAKRLAKKLGRSKDKRLVGYIISVKGHVLLIGTNGEVLVDTSPDHTKKNRIMMNICAILLK